MSGIFDQIVTYSPRTVDGSGGTVLLAANNLGDVSSAENARLNLRAASETQAGLRYAMPYWQCDGATTSRRFQATGINLAGSDCTLASAWFQMGGSGTNRIFDACSATSGLPLPLQLTCVIAASNALVVAQYGATTSDHRTLTFFNIRSTYSGQWCRLFVAFTGNSTTAPTVWLLTQTSGLTALTGGTETTGGTPLNWADAALVSTYLLQGYNMPAVPFIPGAIINRRWAQADVEAYVLSGRFAYADAAGGSTTAQTSGALIVGRRYRIAAYVAGDSFTNVGAASNATGVEFIATGTTPTTWTNSSSLIREGVLTDPTNGVQPCYVADDASPNGVPWLVVGYSPVTESKEFRIPATVDMSAGIPGNKQLLAGALFADPTKVALDTIETRTTGTPTFSVGDGTTATRYTASVAHSAGRLRETLSNNFPADSAKTGLYANVTVAGGAAEKLLIRGHIQE